jgi:hypothetical protein
VATTTPVRQLGVAPLAADALNRNSSRRLIRRLGSLNLTPLRSPIDFAGVVSDEFSRAAKVEYRYFIFNLVLIWHFVHRGHAAVT